MLAATGFFESGVAPKRYGTAVETRTRDQQNLLVVSEREEVNLVPQLRWEGREAEDFVRRERFGGDRRLLIQRQAIRILV